MNADEPVDGPDGEEEEVAEAVDVDDAASVADVEIGQVDDAADADGAPVEISEEAVVALIAERDDYLDQLQRMKAEFANARRRSAEQAETVRKQAASDLVQKLLPVLDSAHAALDQGVDEVRPLSDALMEALTSQGLSVLDPVGEPFDPEQHEAVMFESSDDPAESEQVVAETMRLGYLWNDRVLRAAMVKVRG